MTQWKVRQHQTKKAWVVDPPGYDKTNRREDWQRKGGIIFHYGYSLKGDGATSAKARKRAFAHARAQSRKVTLTIPEAPRVLDLVGYEVNQHGSGIWVILRGQHGDEIRIYGRDIRHAAADLLLLTERNKL